MRTENDAHDIAAMTYPFSHDSMTAGMEDAPMMIVHEDLKIIVDDEGPRKS